MIDWMTMDLIEHDVQESAEITSKSERRSKNGPFDNKEFSHGPGVYQALRYPMMIGIGGNKNT